MRRQMIAVTLGLLVFGACADPAERRAAVSPETVGPALESVTADRLLGHIEVLASDEFEGRLPGTAGEEKTVSYLIEQFHALGLEPGNPDGGYTQDVTLVGVRSTTTGSIRAGDRTLPLRFPDNFVGVSYRDGDRVEVNGSDWCSLGTAWTRRSTVGRLQGPGYGRQDAGDAGERSAGR